LQGDLKISGRYQDLLKSNHMEFSNLMKSKVEAERTRNDSVVSNGNSRKNSVYSIQSENDALLPHPTVLTSELKLNLINKNATGKPIYNSDEKQATGSVKRSVYLSFAKFGTGYIAPILVLLLFILSEGASISADYWLSHWLIHFKS
jgi:hypothetical protein